MKQFLTEKKNEKYLRFSKRKHSVAKIKNKIFLMALIIIQSYCHCCKTNRKWIVRIKMIKNGCLKCQIYLMFYTILNRQKKYSFLPMFEILKVDLFNCYFVSFYVVRTRLFLVQLTVMKIFTGNTSFDILQLLSIYYLL